MGNKKNPGSPVSNPKRGKKLAKLVDQAIYSVISPKERDHSRTLATPSGRAATISAVSKTQMRQPQLKSKLKGEVEGSNQPGRLDQDGELSKDNSKETADVSNHYATLPAEQHAKRNPSLLLQDGERTDRQRGASINGRLETEFKQEPGTQQPTEKERLTAKPQHRS